jgi:hypothetical protein
MFIDENKCFGEVEFIIDNELKKIKVYSPETVLNRIIEKNSAFFNNEVNNETLVDHDKFEEGEICRYTIYDDVELVPILTVAVHISEVITNTTHYSETIH